MRTSLPKMLAIAALAFIANLAMAQTFDYPVKGKQGFNLTEKTRGGLHISYNLGQMSLSQIDYRGEALSEISIASITIPADAGSPNLPMDSRMMAIPQGATASLRVVSVEKETLHNVNIAPALRIQAENEEPDMNYVKDMAIYGKNAFYPAEPFTMGNSYIRGVDAVTVAITPFQYNPVTKDLIVYTNIELAVEFEGGTDHFGEDRLRSPYWDPILAAELLNYDQLPVIDYEARMQEWLRDDKDGAEYLIITPNNDAWAEYANQLKDYRIRQGIITKVYRLDQMPANNTAQMKSWFHNAYHTWDIAPVAICLLGDHGTDMGQYIPAETTYHAYSGSCITDNFYADAQGNDNLPDMVFSRLVAQNASELPIFVSKQLEYEYTNPNMDPDFYTRPITALGWQTERWFQLCSEVFGGYMRNHGYDTNRINCIYSGTPGSQWSSAQNTNLVVNYFGPNGLGYIPATPSELGDWNNGSPQLVVQAINDGAFWLQHRDHGLEEGWGEPAVRNNHINQMNNVGKLPFVMSINCQTGMFNYSGSGGNCFTEKWMRRTYDGQNAGAVGVLSPTEVSYSFVNDAFVWGVYDLFDGDFMPTYGPYAENTGNWMPAFGNVAGKYFLAQSSWPYNTDDKDITYTMFTAHCDAFLRIYTQVPQTMEVVHPEVVLAGIGEVSITAPEGCVISLVIPNDEGSWDILAVAEATGEPQTIEFEPQYPPTEINLVITGQNYLRYEAIMSVIPANGPYIVYDSKVIHDSNGNGNLDFGETISLDVTLRNVGSDAMEAFEAVLETDSEYITITNGTASFEGMSPNALQTVEDAFTLTVAGNVPDNTTNRFTITVTNGDDTYISNLTMKAYAPVFELGGMSITEIEGNGNGRLEAGESATLSFPIGNTGHADAAATLVTLNLLSPYITLEENTVSSDFLNTGETMTASYNISVSETTPMGYICPLTLEVISGQYLTQQDYEAKVGLVIEDFETGEFGEGWNNDATRPWRFVTEDPYEGQYCLRSGSIGNNATTTLTLTHEAGSADTISFYYKVSSENGYDKLHFYIDNQEKENWSGSVNWTKAAYRVNQGRHTYKWTYTKDAYQIGDSDCAWIDFVGLPADRIMAGTAGNDVSVCEGTEAQIVGYAMHYDNLLWTTSGDGTFDDATSYMPIYSPGAQDIANGSATLTITINGEGETITDEMTVFITKNVYIDNALFDYYYCATTEPQEVAVFVEGDYVSFQWLTDGDGEFEDATALATTYTPGLGDIANGVTITAFAVSPGCGSFTYEYPFDMNPMPEMTLATNAIEICEGENAVMNYSMSGSSGTIGIEPEFVFWMNGVNYNAHSGNNDLDLGTFEVGEHVFNISRVENTHCGLDYETDELTFTVTVNAAPTMTIGEVPESICEGETIDVEFNFTGVAPFMVEATGMDSFTSESDNYTMTLTPAATINATLTKVTDANGCETTLEQAINVVVNPVAAQPEISGDTELDVRLVPTSTYTIDNDVIVSYTLEPEEAGTLTPANDGKSAMITWSDTYKGEVVLTATPSAECNNGGNSLTISVKNSTDIDEFGVKASLYPNPTNGNVTIEADGMQRLTVVNELGQVVYDAEVRSDIVTLNMGQFGAGVFMIRIYTENGMGVKRISVIK